MQVTKSRREVEMTNFEQTWALWAVLAGALGMAAFAAVPAKAAGKCGVETAVVFQQVQEARAKCGAKGGPMDMGHADLIKMCKGDPSVWKRTKLAIYKQHQACKG